MSTNQDEAILRSQKIVDLRQRMLHNLSLGKPSQEGIPPDELREAVAALRSVRATAGARGGTAKATNAKQTDGAALASLNEKLKASGLDLD
jgi:hypothetical protein